MLSLPRMDATRLLGVASALVLVATLAAQLRAQWRRRSTEGVSRFLFVGQLGASCGFTAYSALIGDPVFVVVNVAIGLTAIAGVVLTAIVRRGARGSGARAA